MDLQDATRRDDAYQQLLAINELVTNLPLFPSLGWVWTFDIIKDIFDNEKYVDVAGNQFADEAVPEGVTLKQIFDKFYENIDNLGLEMDHGGELLEEVIRDWMRDNDFLVTLDNDGWLDD